MFSEQIDLQSSIVSLNLAQSFAQELLFDFIFYYAFIAIYLFILSSWNFYLFIRCMAQRISTEPPTRLSYPRPSRPSSDSSNVSASLHLIRFDLSSAFHSLPVSPSASVPVLPYRSPRVRRAPSAPIFFRRP